MAYLYRISFSREVYSTLSGEGLKHLGSLFSLAHDLGFTVKRAKTLAEPELTLHLELVGGGSSLCLTSMTICVYSNYMI